MALSSASHVGPGRSRIGSVSVSWLHGINWPWIIC